MAAKRSTPACMPDSPSLSLLPMLTPRLPAPRPSLGTDAYAALKQAIRENALPPGYQGSEQEIAGQLGMSRTPVHEALIRLQAEGLVRVLARRGVQVCALSPDDMAEIYEAALVLESGAAELLAAAPPDRRAAAAAELGALTAQMESALAADDLVAWAHADDRFHRRLLELPGNARLAQMFHTIMDQSHRARMLTLRLRPRPTASAPEHTAIAAAIAAGDPAAARAAAAAHRRTARDRLLPLLAQAGMNHL